MVKRRDRLDDYLDSLPREMRTKLEEEAMRGASGFLLETLKSDNGDGPLAEECRRQIMKAFIKASRNGKGDENLKRSG